MRGTTCLGVAIVLSAFLNALAAEPLTPTPPPAAAQQTRPSAPHEQAARELLTMIGMDQQIRDSAAASIDSQIRSNPAMAPFRDVLLDWVGKYVTWDNLGPQLVELYRQSFTEEELRGLITFYRTPVGRKALEKLPELTRRGMEIGLETAEQHQAELEQKIRERIAQLESAGQTAPQGEAQQSADPPGQRQ